MWCWIVTETFSNVSVLYLFSFVINEIYFEMLFASLFLPLVP